MSQNVDRLIADELIVENKHLRTINEKLLECCRRFLERVENGQIREGSINMVRSYDEIKKVISEIE